VDQAALAEISEFSFECTSVVYDDFGWTSKAGYAVHQEHMEGGLG
jgi:hypothetical protein